jgi:hypothetical protein
VATPTDQLLLLHPGDRPLVLPKTKAPLARQLEAAGLVSLSAARNGALTVELTEAGRLRREELQLESLARAEPPPTPRPARAPARSPARSPAPAPTKRAASLDDLFGQGAFKPSLEDNRPVTAADLAALEERLVARFRQMLEEALHRR